MRDATLTLIALMNAGYFDEAKAWRDWLLRAAAGAPSQLQIMYGLAGERRLTEYSIPWLPGYERSAPVRVGNAAAAQLQLDASGPGEIAETLGEAEQPTLAVEHFGGRDGGPEPAAVLPDHPPIRARASVARRPHARHVVTLGAGLLEMDIARAWKEAKPLRHEIDRPAEGKRLIDEREIGRLEATLDVFGASTEAAEV